MKVRGVVWLGFETSRYADMRRFFGDLLGLPVVFEGHRDVEFECPNGVRVQLTSSATDGPAVPLFEVDDVQSAKRELESASVEVVGPIQGDAEWEWIVVRAPDGRTCEFGSRKSGRA